MSVSPYAIKYFCFIIISCKNKVVKLIIYKKKEEYVGKKLDAFIASPSPETYKKAAALTQTQ
jgi:hypothetical protein